MIDIYAQRITPDGIPLWAADGAPVCTAEDQQRSPDIVSDGEGGAVIVWSDSRDFDDTGNDIYAQRIDAEGTRLWAVEDVPLCTFVLNQRSPHLIVSGPGETIVLWNDYRNDLESDVYAAKLDSNGNSPPTGAATPPPTAARLYQNIPNPFNPATTIWFDIIRPTHVRLDIYDVTGALIRRLIDGQMMVGRNEIHWDGTDTDGRTVASGVYFYRLEAGMFKETKKMVLLR